MTTEHETMTTENGTNARTTEPYPIDSVFDLPIDELIIDPSKSLRSKPTDEEVLRMAGSLLTATQIESVLVVWRGNAYELVTGYTRALAIRTHGDEFGLKKTIRAMSIKPEKVDVARMTDALVFRAPTLFEQARVLDTYEPLCQSITHLAIFAAKSPEYVSSLIRIYRGLPPFIKAEWAADREHRFTYHRLTDLVRLWKKNNQAGAVRLLKKILADPKKKRGGAAKLPYKTGEECLDESLAGCGFVRHGMTLVPDLRALNGEKKKKRQIRRLTRGQVEKMQARLEVIPQERLNQSTVSADVFRRFLSAFLGKVDLSEAWSIVEALEHDLKGGEHNVDQPGADLEPSTDVSLAPPQTVPAVVEDLQQADFTPIPPDELDELDEDEAETLMSELPIQSARDPAAGASALDGGIAASSMTSDALTTRGGDPGALLQAQLASLAPLAGPKPSPSVWSKMRDNPMPRPFGNRKPPWESRPWTPTYSDGSPRPKEPVRLSAEELANCLPPDDDDDEYDVELAFALEYARRVDPVPNARPPPK